MDWILGILLEEQFVRSSRQSVTSLVKMNGVSTSVFQSWNFFGGDLEVKSGMDLGL
jgi:hypothetical protein